MEFRCKSSRKIPNKLWTATLFIQPLQYKRLPVSNEIGMPAGNLDKGCYLYIGSAAQRIDQQFGCVVIAPSQSYLVIKAQSVSLGGEVLYVRAILQPLAG